MLGKLVFILLTSLFAVSAELEEFCNARFGDKIYYAETTTPMTWSDSKLECAKHGLYLATVETDDDKWPLASCLQQYSGKWFWTSATGALGNLRWDQTGERVNEGYFDKVRDWPPPTGNEGPSNGPRCGVMSHDFKYLDHNNCSKKHYFLCQRYAINA